MELSFAHASEDIEELIRTLNEATQAGQGDTP